MTLTLRAHPASISAAALKHDDPLRVLRVLNHVPSWSKCSINVRKPDSNVTSITFTFRGAAGWSPNIIQCLDGTVPEVFDCDLLTFGQDKAVYRLNDPRRALDRSYESLELPLTKGTPRVDRQGQNELVLVNYRRPFILPDFTSVDTIVAALRTNTFLRCGSPALGERQVTVSLLAEEPRTVTRVGFNKVHSQQLQTRRAPLHIFTHDLDSQATIISLLLWVDANALAESRYQIYAGAVPVTPPNATNLEALFAPLRAALDGGAKRYLGISAEIAAPSDRLSYDLDHSLVPDAGYRRLVDLLSAWLHTIANSARLHDLQASTREYRDIRVADALQVRQTQLRRARVVCYGQRPLLQEPRSEKDVLALYFKLEGGDALPVSHCCVLEHTPSRGTDAIGHFRVREADALNQYALIEFEYKFANFLAHGHSVRHVDLVICWTTSRSDPVRSTEYPWLMAYSAGDVQKTIPVLVLERIPGLEVRSA